MIRSVAKVTVEETDEGIVVSIYPNPVPWQIVALSVWSALWVFCGVWAMVGTLKSPERDAMVFLVVFLGFWLYFLFYAVRSLLWQRTGAEYLRIGGETLDYKRSWGGYGKVRSFDLQTIKHLGIVNYKNKSFAKTYSDAFWTIGGEMIGFEYLGQKVAFGLKLDQKQAKDIVRHIEGAQRKR